MDYTAYPPSIEGVIPAFTGYTIVVPFTHNPAVALSQVVGYSLKLRYINNELIKNINGEFTINNGIYDASTKTVSFNLQGDKDDTNIKDPYPASFVSYSINTIKTIEKSIHIGDYFKIQLAYIFKDSVSQSTFIGAYSTIGVTKRCAVPIINITGLNAAELNRLTKNQTFEGNYTANSLDPDERLYSYKMDLYDENLNLLDSSGEKLFFSLDSETTTQSISYTFYTAIQKNKIYKIQFSGTTVNGLKVQTALYQLMEMTTKTWELNGIFWAELNRENAYISLSFLEDFNDNASYLAPGKYLISRDNSEDNYSTILPIGTVIIDTNWVRESPEIFKDFCIEQGVTYRYYLQQYNNYNIYSEPIFARSECSEKEETIAEIKADFEHIFLYDGKVQLKISLNPQVSSFKTTLLEQKSDTIGGKYPFFYSNGQIEYKEIPISGLISYHMDDEELFCSKEELWLEDIAEIRFDTPSDVKLNYNIPTTNQVDYNFTAERKFKLKVLDWLNNKQYKLFKSPTEGNYIVRLMNVSLSPDTQLSRLLHTFSATGYECADLTYENLINYKFHNVIDKTLWTDWPVSIQLKDLEPDEDGWYTVTKTNTIVKELVCQDLHFGDKVELTFSGGTKSEIVIGPTGAYQIRSEFGTDIEIINIRIKKYVQHSTLGTISYVAIIPASSDFDNLKDIIYTTLIATPYKNIKTIETPIDKNENITNFYYDSDKNQSRFYVEFNNTFRSKDLYELEIEVDNEVSQNEIKNIFIEFYTGDIETIEIVKSEYNKNNNTTLLTTKIFNITPAINGVMIYYNGNYKPLAWRLYKDRVQNLTKAICNYSETTDIINLHLIQFLVPNPVEEAYITLSFKNLDNGDIIEEQRINIANNRWYNLYVNYTIKEESVNIIPLISMSENVIAYVTGITQTEVYE